MFKKVLFLFTAGILCYACATVPVTGRSQLSLVSNSEIIPMAAQQYDEVLKKGPISSNKEQADMVKRVGLKIQKAVESYMAEKGASAELEGFAWEFNLIDDPQTVNAWCMPGGKVAFYTAIMPICKDENG
ncbi:MAG: M48 family peptidase, partial [Cytophagia bacterium]|nr:M48 family peptidase [Cytophagia bacterium]